MASTNLLAPTGATASVPPRSEPAAVGHPAVLPTLVRDQLFLSADISDRLHDRPLFLEAAVAQPSAGAADADELAKKLANPVAALISIPFQFNYEPNLGSEDNGERFTLNIQPVIPITLNEDWNLISRTIVPIIYQDDVTPGGDSQFGFGDTVQSFFFSPAKPTAGGLIWGVGPVLLIPTSTEGLGANRWGIGPTGVLLKQDGPWTFGLLANHIWSLGSNDDFDNGQGRPDVNATFLQPFVSYAFGKGWSGTLNVESTYDWNTEQWTVPVFAGASKVFAVGGQPMSLAAGVRVYADGPDNAPDWGLRVVYTLLLPK
ncbi:transporter family protein [Humisphaera borealis]|uniref:hypothetical protein n=1 Tax=Humisphaera borealis TaxID=2807512 RepID=UPI0019D1F51A|nr:hypothetical protein [Humisphaera borealis]